MNKAELIKELESRLGSRKAASDALTAVVDVIIREVAKGGSVAITGFGTFEQAARASGSRPRVACSNACRPSSMASSSAKCGPM